MCEVINFTKFDPLNPNYDVLQFDDVPVRKRFRYGGKWMVKTGPDWATHKDPKIGQVYYKMYKDRFVLIIKKSPLTY